MTEFNPHPSPKQKSPHRHREKNLGTPELIAIALGGMVGGGIFTVLGLSVGMIGVFTPLAFLIGGAVALLASYSYVKLGVYFKDEGASYAFFKKTFPGSHFAASLIGWYVIFGFISTLAIYAYTFSAYFLSSFELEASTWLRQGVAIAMLGAFALINIWSVKGMGRLEDFLVYGKLVILAVIAFVLINYGDASLPELLPETDQPLAFGFQVLIVAALTFVAYEGFQLVANAVNEIEAPEKRLPISMYSAIGIAAGIYFLIALGAVLAIPFEQIIENKEHALAAGTSQALGHWGLHLMVLGALMATSSAVSGTLFGASRQMAVIAEDGYFPPALARRSAQHIPVVAIVTMAAAASLLILIGNLKMLVEFGSITFLWVSLLMAVANYRIRHLTGAHPVITLSAIVALMLAVGLILYYEIRHAPAEVTFIISLYIGLTLSAWGYARWHCRQRT